jgi:hypothetical protein
MKARSRSCRDPLSGMETRRFFPIRGERQAVEYIVKNLVIREAAGRFTPP